MDAAVSAAVGGCSNREQQSVPTGRAMVRATAARSDSFMEDCVHAGPRGLAGGLLVLRMRGAFGHPSLHSSRPAGDRQLDLRSGGWATELTQNRGPPGSMGELWKLM